MTYRKNTTRRDVQQEIGSQAYAFEELVAELTSAMLCSPLVIEDTPREDHVRYVKSWLDILKSDKRAIFTAASKAQAATGLIPKYAVAEGAQEDTHDSLEEALQVAAA